MRKVLLISATTALVSSFVLQSRLIRPTVGALNESKHPTVSSSQDQFKKSIASRIEYLNKAVIAGTLGTFLPQTAYADAAVPTTDSAASDGFIATASGLKYQDIKVGDGASPLPGDTVRVHYTGWLEDFESKKKFDSSYDRRSPLVFKVN